MEVLFTDDSGDTSETSGLKGAKFSGKSLNVAVLFYFQLHKWLSVIKISPSASSTEWIFFSWWLTPRIPKKQTPIKVTKSYFRGPVVGGGSENVQEDF